MKSIESKLKEIAKKALPEMQFVFGSLMEIDAKLDLLKPPYMYVVYPDVGTLTYRRGRFWESLNVLVGFFDAVQRDAQGEDNIAVYGRMIEAAKAFIRAYNEDGYFEPLEGDIKTTLLTEVGAVYVSGCYIDIVVSERDGRC